MSDSLSSASLLLPREDGFRLECSFEFPNFGITVLFGASGSGKTTVLRCIAGLERAKGFVKVDGVYWQNDEQKLFLPTWERPLGYVFQEASLFPHLTAKQNIEFAVKRSKSTDARSRMEEAIDLLGIRGLLGRKPAQLSGGERQRVAIARAVATEPKIMLFDEPLAALDLKLRKEMQYELKRIQQQMGITFIYVTHDQEEALTMSDTVVVMDKGRIQQIGTPEDIYNEPKNAFVADFIGESNILNGTMVRDRVVKMYGKEFPCVDGGFAENEPVDVVIRPEDIDIVPVEQGQLVGTVTNVTFKGMQYDIIVDFRGFKWLIQTTDHSPVGARIGVKIDPEGFHIMKKSEYSGMFGDYSSYSEEYEELADAGAEPEEEESEDEE